ncbi:ChaC family protein [Paracidovorax avenae ATCC 19860]|uniref:glutathione-specific gamma-glutamylcyclotransferase n=1 Tax=Paracidovorax avenae (strain ATCC 19860 / DSM 7227 / CCUG 15838 / JCM 20985 / LMG 2117 / NCPPB 1011) TaxID=643561 RepID=F0QDC4_PARA1|nr:ChaC family protein [Paracidovorax avenae ATCC 19860]
MNNGGMDETANCSGAAPAALPSPVRDPAPMLERALAEWGGTQDLWIFGYGSLIWRPDFEFAEQRLARVHGWHRALKMWSRVNRGTPECPGLVLGMFPGGSCRGMVFRVERAHARQVMINLWQREMPTGVYDPRWLPCSTPLGTVRALAFTLSRSSPNHTGELSEAEYRRIFLEASGRYGTTLHYAQATYDGLRRLGIEDRALARLLRFSPQDSSAG